MSVYAGSLPGADQYLTYDDHGSRQGIKAAEENAAERRTAEEQKTIEPAKALLMERNQMTEMDAHKYIQKLSMDSGNNLVETAEMILAFE